MYGFYILYINLIINDDFIVIKRENVKSVEIDDVVLIIVDEILCLFIV